jgi:hypothetical protein
MGQPAGPQFGHLSLTRNPAEADRISDEGLARLGGTAQVNAAVRPGCEWVGTEGYPLRAINSLIDFNDQISTVIMDFVRRIRRPIVAIAVPYIHLVHARSG